MGLREFLRGGYHDIREKTVITDRGRPYAMFVPRTEVSLLRKLSTGTFLTSDDENDVVSSDPPEGASNGGDAGELRP